MTWDFRRRFWIFTMTRVNFRYLSLQKYMPPRIGLEAISNIRIILCRSKTQKWFTADRRRLESRIKWHRVQQYTTGSGLLLVRAVELSWRPHNHKIQKQRKLLLRETVVSIQGKVTGRKTKLTLWANREVVVREDDFTVNSLDLRMMITRTSERSPTCK